MCHFSSCLCLTLWFEISLLRSKTWQLWITVQRMCAMTFCLHVTQAFCLFKYIKKYKAQVGRITINKKMKILFGDRVYPSMCVWTFPQHPNSHEMNPLSFTILQCKWPHVCLQMHLPTITHHAFRRKEQTQVETTSQCLSWNCQH